ncbi:MAG TPA: MG2 domain-containing protein, partial [Thermoanaerobaculales bacterium]|nr:MG2 domain-containing protein [Thermoanaerobaculales bacterium]
MQHPHTIRRLTLAVIPFVLAGLAAGLHAVAPPPQDGGQRITAPEGPTVTWEEIDKLVSEQKLEAAAAAVAELRESARASGDNAAWTRALVTEVQLRMGLHGYETAVRFLREAEWPSDAVSRAVLDLYYAQSLVSYAGIYSWEIRDRERVASDDEVDLKRWTLEQIVAEANRAYGRVWHERGRWGEASIGELARYIEQNDYPARIRGTLRDAVSYLWVELLADSSLWRPGQANQLYQLDAPALIAGDPAHSGELDLADPRVHPLSKIGAVLDDLESWHHSAGRPEAALEARLERLRRLHAAFSSSHDKRAVREHLQSVQSEFDRSFEWWSMGQAALAEMLQGEDEGDSLVRARQEAQAGAERHPSSVGGARCRHLVAAIEAPAFTLEAMALDAANRRSIRVTHRNLDALHFRAYAFDLEDAVTGAKDYNLLPGYREVPGWIDSRKPAAAWTEELPATPDYRDHASDATPPMTAPGAYLVVVSARRDFAREGNQMNAVNLVIGDLVLVSSQVGGGWEVAARSGGSGLPLAGAEISLYRADWRRGHRLVDEKRTGIDGLARFADLGQRPDQYFLLGSWQDHVSVDTSFLYRFEEPSFGVDTGAFLYTDRSVYRPQQTIHWKVVAYRGGGDEQRYRTSPRSPVTVTLTDANGEEVASRQLTTNDFGSASGSFEIPPGRLLGAWQLQSSLGGATQLRVEEYKRPTFEVTVEEPSEPLRLNRAAALSGSARYYFGLPVSAGDVAWRVAREPVYPRWWYWWAPAPATEAEIVASGAARLDADGRFTVAFTPAADEREAEIEGISYRYRLTAEVTDEGGETRSATRAFRLGFVAVEARIDSPLAFLPARQHAELKVHRSDLDGTPRAGAGSWRIVELVQPDRALLPADEPVPAPPGAEDRFRTPGDQRRPRWDTRHDPDSVMARWPEGREVAAGRLTHGEDGSATVNVRGLAAGAYRLVYTTIDDFGATAEASRNLIVAAERGCDVALPALLLAERSSVPVGETARLLVRSGLRDQEIVLETFRDGRRISRRVLHAGYDAELIEIPITEADRGGFGVSLTVLRDHQLVRQTTSIHVPWDDRQLQLEFASFRETLRPGASESFRVTVRGHDQAAVDAGTAELLAYMYDRSLDIFAPHTPPSPQSLYPDRSSVGRQQSNLGTAQHAWSWSSGFAELPGYPSLSGDRLKLLDGYGIGGMGRRGMYMAKTAGLEAQRMPAPATMADAVMAPESEADEARLSGKEEIAEAAPPETPGGEGVALREDFSETAFFSPHLLLGPDGSAAIEFQVPDSVTEWNVWVHAITTDLRAGSIERQARSVKELMVRPYLPRFLREGDRAAIRVVVNNAGASPLDGTLDFEISDPDTGEDLRGLFGLPVAAASGVTFSVEPGKGTTLEFPVAVPARVGTVAFTATARAGAFSDGERRPLPVLPGRVHLAQSRFAALRDADRRELDFADMREPDPTLIHDQLVVTVDAQLFYSVLNALPYLVSYPYECTEQTLNRFLSTGILSSLYGRYPAVARMAAEFSTRDTRLETWEATDPNRKMALEETPWLQTARGGSEQPDELINVLDPRIANAQRASALAKLEQSQTSLGAFPWFPGGPPSPYMTLYILYGFSKALEFDVEVPRPVVERAWAYMHQHYVDELVDLMMGHDCCWETITFLNYVLSSYPDESWTGGVFTADDQSRMLEFSFRHWKQHQPLLKGYLALTLERAGRHDDAKLVFDSVMDSAKTDQDLGTYWAPEDRAWLWYNDTIESHAMALRTLTELEPADGRRHGLVQWLLLNKKLNHWKSTRATAEVIYSLIHYLEHEGQLGQREDATVTVGPIRQAFVFEPDEYSGARNRVIVPGPAIDPATMSTVIVEKSAKGFAFASATWHFSTEQLPEEARGDLFAITRSYYKRTNVGDEWVLEPLAEGAALAPGDQVEVHLSIRAKHAAEYVHVRDPRGAGFEPEKLASGWRWDLGISAYEEIRDSGTNFFIEWLPAGEYTLTYRLRA